MAAAESPRRARIDWGPQTTVSLPQSRPAMTEAGNAEMWTLGCIPEALHCSCESLGVVRTAVVPGQWVGDDHSALPRLLQWHLAEQE